MNTKPRITDAKLRSAFLALSFAATVALGVAIDALARGYASDALAAAQAQVHRVASR